MEHNYLIESELYERGGLAFNRVIFENRSIYLSGEALFETEYPLGYGCNTAGGSSAFEQPKERCHEESYAFERHGYLCQLRTNADKCI